MKTEKLLVLRNTFLGLSMAFILLVSCTKSEEATDLDDMEVTEGNIETDINILEFISNRQDATIFNALIENSSSEVKALLSGDEDYTIFVPTDEAWEAFFNNYLEYESVDDLTIEKRADLRDILVKYHMVQGVLSVEDFIDGEDVQSVEGQTFKTFVSGDRFFIDDITNYEFNDTDAESNVTEADLIVSNGVVHIVDEILLPVNVIQTLARKIIERDDTTIMEEALRKTDLLDYYRDITRTAGLIPTDTAWENCFMLLGDEFNSLDDFDTDVEIELLRQIVLEQLTASDGTEFSFMDVLNGDKQIAFRDSVQNFPYGFKDATGLISQVVDYDGRVENRSELYLIDRVLLPQVAVDYILKNYQDSLMDFVMKLDDFKTLNDAVASFPADKLPTFLKNGTPFTLFLPSPEALSALENVYGDLNTQEGREILANILGYHFIFGQKISSSDVEFNRSYATFQYESLSFEQNNGSINVIDSKGNQAATVLSVDNDFSGGTIHLIDNVLLPAELDFY